MVAALHDPDGRVTVPGFYDAVEELSDQDRALLAKAPFDETAYCDELEIPQTYGEKGFSTPERIGIRPTLELNGIWGGYQGEGSKTIVPASAHAKITCRLVPHQDPDDIAAKMENYIHAIAPPAVRVATRGVEHGAFPYAMSAEYPGNQVAAGVLEEIYGAPPYFFRGGGTVPACSLFLKILDVLTINFSFGLGDERLHAPNEFFRLASFYKGQRAYCLLFNALRNSAPALRRKP
jgi:acetylornithine deacetylase/succinyl-diaminopimelate desuccinylase-like protein